MKSKQARNTKTTMEGNCEEQNTACSIITESNLELSQFELELVNRNILVLFGSNLLSPTLGYIYTRRIMPMLWFYAVMISIVISSSFFLPESVYAEKRNQVLVSVGVVFIATAENGGAVLRARRKFNSYKTK